MNPEYIEYRIHDHLEWITYVMIHTMLMKPDYRITCHIIRHASTGFSSRLIYVITVDDTRLRVRYTEAKYATECNKVDKQVLQNIL